MLTLSASKHFSATMRIKASINVNAEYSGSYTYSSDGFTFTKSTAENTAIDYTSDKEFT